MHYNRPIYYDPVVGRFISEDPIKLMGGTNLFVYAPNPFSWIDPWGLAKLGRWESVGQGQIRIDPLTWKYKPAVPCTLSVPNQKKRSSHQQRRGSEPRIKMRCFRSDQS
ncbi:RHS repeat-associated core domain-containing protein [Acidovorax sp. PRC11]|nr:RHS repeat-associated core domain-containing protein [Acidovorax sp. PRC11]MDT0137218.1 RHS repeat-associated core domain-containing protein [Acidovorax sp. PRC11]